MRKKSAKKKRDAERPAFEIVAVAASAGGLNALSLLVRGLPREFPAALLIVQHLDPRHRSLIADILSRRTQLRVKQAQDGEAIAAGSVYIAPPRHPLLVHGDHTLSPPHT